MIVWTSDAGNLVLSVSDTTSSVESLCPDLLRYEQIGAADGWRGRVVRAFFFVMRAGPT